MPKKWWRETSNASLTVLCMKLIGPLLMNRCDHQGCFMGSKVSRGHQSRHRCVLLKKNCYRLWKFREDNCAVCENSGENTLILWRHWMKFIKLRLKVVVLSCRHNFRPDHRLQSCKQSPERKYWNEKMGGNRSEEYNNWCQLYKSF